MHVDGVGIEDFEECERTFTKSNELASSTRLSVAMTTTSSRLVVVVVVDFSRVGDRLDYDYSTNYDYDYRKCCSW
jgi:hypothetical protein